MKRHFNSTIPLQHLVPASTVTGLISHTPARMEPACTAHCQETKLSHCILPDVHIMSDTALQSAEQSSSHLLTPWDNKSTQLGFTTNVYVIQLYVHIVYQPWWYVSWEIQRKIQPAFIPWEIIHSSQEVMMKINVALTHLCPSILLHLVFIWSSLYFHFSSQSLLSFGVFGTASSSPIMTVLSFHTHSPFLSLLFHSFIFYCFNRNTQPSHRVWTFPHYNLLLLFYLHSSSFLDTGDFTFISSSFTLHSSLFLCWCLPVSFFFFF